MYVYAQVKRAFQQKVITLSQFTQRRIDDPPRLHPVTIAQDNSEFKVALVVGAPTGVDLERAGIAARVVPVRATYRDEARVLLDYLRTFSEGAVALVRGDAPDAEACSLALRDEARARNRPLTCGSLRPFRRRARQFTHFSASIAR